MDRYGDSQFRGQPRQGPGNYPNRPPGSGRGSSILGQMPIRRSQGYQDSHYSSSTSQPGYNKPQWKANQPSGMIGATPKRDYDPDNGNYNKPASFSGQARNLAGNPTGTGPVPGQLRKLMQSFGLSQSDVQKLSQLPEKELSAGNLARAIGNIRQEKERSGRRDTSQERRFQSSNPDNNYQESFSRTAYRNDNRDRDSFDNNYDNFSSRQQDGGRMHQQNRPKLSGDDMRNEIHSSISSRNKPTGVKVTIKPSDSRGPDRFRDQGYFGDRQDRGDHYSNDSNRRGNYANDQSNDRYDSYNKNSNRDNYNKSGNGHQEQNYGNNRGYNNQAQTNNRSGLRGPGQLQGVRGVQKQSGNIQSLLGVNASPPSKMVSPSSLLGVSSGLLGNPMQPNSVGLDSLAAQVRTPVNAVSQAASLLNPLILASQAADPNVLEAQIQAMKVLQAELRNKQPQNQGNRRDNDRQRPMIRRDRQQSPSMNIKQEAREISDEMRNDRGKVLYIRYKSHRINELDLRKLASPFGRITHLFTIRAKIPNGHHQTFMEIESSDCAAAMLENYIIYPPTIKDGPVLVERSNHRDLRTRQQNHEIKRLRSMSPLREGTTQLSSRKRTRDEKINVSVSSENKRIVTKHDDRKRSRSSKDHNDSKKLDSKDGKSGDKKSTSPRRDSRRALDRRRSDARKSRFSDKDDKKLPEDNTEVKTDTPKEEGANKGNEAESVSKEKDVSVKEEKLDIKKEATDIEDPLDAIADEIALAEDFVLMDEVKEKKDEEEQIGGESHTGVDLDSGDMDLENVNVEESGPQDGDVEEKMEDDPIQEEDAKEDNDKSLEENKNEEDSKVEDQTVEDRNDEEVKEVEEGVESIKEVDAEKMEEENSSQNDDEFSQNESLEIQETDLNSAVDSSVESESFAANEFNHFAVLDSTGCDVAENGEGQEGSSPAPEDQNDYDEDQCEESDGCEDINSLKTVISSTLEDVLKAQTQLVALVKSTKNQKSQAIAKRLKEHLDDAIGTLQNASTSNYKNE